MSKTYKRFFMIDEQHQPLINEYFNLKRLTDKLANTFINKHDVKDVYINNGNIIYITFNKKPDTLIWKKVNDGYMPRVKNKLLCQEIKSIKYPCSRKIIITPIFGDPMKMILMGEMKHNGAIPMYSAQFYGNGKYFIDLPWSDSPPQDKKHYLNQPIPAGLTEIKEWEMLKIIDENKPKQQ